MAKTYFTKDELTCQCGCGRSDMNPEFMEALNGMREAIGRPFVLTSAFRCPEHNNNVSSTGFNGPHTTGRAVDIVANARLKSLIVKESLKRGINRFGMARSYIHVDGLRPSHGFDSNVIWTYK